MTPVLNPKVMNMKTAINSAAAGTLAALLIGQAAYAQSAVQHASDAGGMTRSDAATPSDNTKSNKVDPSDSRMTADAQKNDSTDLDLTQRIRKGVMADKSLSTYAHNVKVVSVDGTVTLNGVVRNDAEKRKVAKIAGEVAGKTHVVDALKVAPPKS